MLVVQARVVRLSCWQVAPSRIGLILCRFRLSLQVLFFQNWLEFGRAVDRRTQCHRSYLGVMTDLMEVRSAVVGSIGGESRRVVLRIQELLLLSCVVESLRTL